MDRTVLWSRVDLSHTPKDTLPSLSTPTLFSYSSPLPYHHPVRTLSTTRQRTCPAHVVDSPSVGYRRDNGKENSGESREENEVQNLSEEHRMSPHRLRDTNLSSVRNSVYIHDTSITIKNFNFLLNKKYIGLIPLTPRPFFLSHLFRSSLMEPPTDSSRRLLPSRYTQNQRSRKKGTSRNQR